MPEHQAFPLLTSEVGVKCQSGWCVHRAQHGAVKIRSLSTVAAVVALLSPKGPLTTPSFTKHPLTRLSSQKTLCVPGSKSPARRYPPVCCTLLCHCPSSFFVYPQQLTQFLAQREAAVGAKQLERKY